MIYLDYAATTPLDPRVLEAMLPWLREGYGNAASDHAPGRAAREAVEWSRAQVADLIGATPEEIIWTSGATEANNLAIKGALEFRGLKNPHVVTSRIEHKSVLDTCRYLETRQVRVTYLKPDGAGAIAPEDVLAAATPDTALVSLMWVNNEIGSINAVQALAPALRSRGILLHVDAVQAAGKLAIDLAQTPIDLLTIAAHKLHGPKGVGALFVRKRPRARVTPQMHGGGHEQGMRSGTLATHQLVGMGEACRLARQEMALEMQRVAALREQLWEGLRPLSGIHRNGESHGAAPHILNVSFEGVEGESLRALLPELAISSGSACSSATRESSYVLRALGRDDELAGSSLRFSLGRYTTADEVRRAAVAVVDAVEYLRSLAPQSARSPLGGRAAKADLNGFGYSDTVWPRFAHPARSGVFEASESGVVAARAGTPASKSIIALALKVDGARVLDARFQAYGCPITIAVGEWLAEQALARGVKELGGIDAAQIRAALEIPEDRAHCAVLGEDLVRALVGQTAG